MKLFISSLISDYEGERAAVGHAASVLRWEILRAEDFGAKPMTPQQACLAAVREADIVVLVLGARYGERQAAGLSATHEEWIEAQRTQKPVLVFVESIDREPDQAEFVAAVSGWEGGRFRESFATPDELRDKVTRALADYASVGTVDEAEIASRARSTFEDAVPSRHSLSDPQLTVVVVGGPSQQVLRPSEIERREFVDAIQREAMFGDHAPLSKTEATTPSLNGNQLSIAQGHASVTVGEDGTVVVSRRALSGDWSSGSIPSIIEEDVAASITGALRFVADVLELIDPQHRLTDVIPAATIRGAEHTPWRTRAEASANPGQVTMAMRRVETAPVSPRPAMVRRGVLVYGAEALAIDLTVLLRRQFVGSI
jgi:hypothetical protein